MRSNTFEHDTHVVSRALAALVSSTPPLDPALRALLKLCLTNEISLRAACLQQRMPTARQTLGRYLAAIKAKVPVRRCQ